MGKGDNIKGEVKRTVSELNNKVDDGEKVVKEQVKTFNNEVNNLSKDSHSALDDTMEGAKKLGEGIMEGVSNMTHKIWSEKDTAINKAQESVESVKKSIDTGVKDAKDKLDTGVKNLEKNIESGMETVKKSVDSGVKNVQGEMSKARSKIDSNLKSAEETVESGIKDAKTKMSEIKESASKYIDKTGLSEEEWRDLDSRSEIDPTMGTMRDSLREHGGFFSKFFTQSGWRMENPSSDPLQDFVDGKLVREGYDSGLLYTRDSRVMPVYDGGYRGLSESSIFSSTKPYIYSNNEQDIITGKGTSLKKGLSDLTGYVSASGKDLEKQVEIGANKIQSQIQDGIDFANQSRMDLTSQIAKNESLIQEKFEKSSIDLQTQLRRETLELQDQVKMAAKELKRKIKDNTLGLHDKIGSNHAEMKERIDMSFQNINTIPNLEFDAVGLQERVDKRLIALRQEAKMLNDKLKDGSLRLEKDASLLHVDIDKRMDFLRREALEIQKMASRGIDLLQKQANQLQGKVDADMILLRKGADNVQLDAQRELDQLNGQIRKNYDTTVKDLNQLGLDIRDNNDLLKKDVKFDTKKLHDHIRDGTDQLREIAFAGAANVTNEVKDTVHGINDRVSAGFDKLTADIKYPSMEKIVVDGGQDQWGKDKSWFSEFINNTQSKLSEFFTLAKEEAVEIENKTKHNLSKLEDWGWDAKPAMTDDLLHPEQEQKSETLLGGIKEMTTDALGTIQRRTNERLDEQFDDIYAANHKIKEVGEDMLKDAKQSAREINSSFWRDFDRLNVPSGALYAGVGGITGAFASSMFMDQRKGYQRSWIPVVGLAAIGGWYGLQQPKNKDSWWNRPFKYQKEF